MVAVLLAEFFSKLCFTTVDNAVRLQSVSILPVFLTDSIRVHSCPFVSIRGLDRPFQRSFRDIDVLLTRVGWELFLCKDCCCEPTRVFAALTVWFSVVSEGSRCRAPMVSTNSLV